MQPDDARLQDVRAWLSKAILDLKAAGCGVAGFPISVVRYPLFGTRFCVVATHGFRALSHWSRRTAAQAGISRSKKT
jgi:hypothetical protein